MLRGVSTDPFLDEEMIHLVDPCRLVRAFAPFFERRLRLEQMLLLAARCLILVLLAPILLPDRRAARRELEEDVREFVVNMIVERGGPFEPAHVLGVLPAELHGAECGEVLGVRGCPDERASRFVRGDLHAARGPGQRDGVLPGLPQPGNERVRAPEQQNVRPQRVAARQDRKSTRLNSSHMSESRMPSSA